MLPETLLVQNILALLLVISVALSRSSSRREAAVRLVAAWLFMIGLILAGVCVSPPPIAPWLYCGLLFAASSAHIVRSAKAGQFTVLRFSHIPTVASAGFGLLFLWQGLSGRLQPDIDTINLAAPMPRGEGICVLSGGNSLALNAHFLSGGSPNGVQEIHSVDFIKLRPGGLRTRSWRVDPQPQDITEYLVYEEPVFAPCDGTIESLKNDHPDHPAGGEYRDRSGVNYVTLRCDRVDIILAHLKRGSIEVTAGQSVDKGEFIGTIGNSGNTEEPHLHIQAQTVLSENSNEEYPRPVAMTFDGRYLSRGECL